jgi:hypothetical protein
MIKTTYKLFFFFLILASTANAQEVFKLNSSGGGFNVMVGYQGFDGSDYFTKGQRFDCSQAIEVRFDDKNVPVALNEATYKQPSNGLLFTGFQGYGVFNSFILGGELNWAYGTSTSGTQRDSVFSTKQIQVSGTTARFSAADVLFNVGFVAFRKRGFVAYPMLGIGYGASGLWMQSQSNNRTYPEIANIVTRSDGNLQNIIVWTRNTVLDFGIGAQYMLGASTEDRAKGFSLGLRVGYKTQLATDNVLVNANKNAKDSFTGENISLPSIGYSGAYVKLLIGFGKIGESR